MSNTNTISFQLNWIRDCLKNWAVTEGGTAEIAHDLSHMWRKAYDGSKAPKCIICCAGEDVRGPFETAAATSRVDRHFVILVTRGRGYSSVRGDTLTEQVGSARPFYELLEEARDIIRVLVFDTAVNEANPALCDPVDYRGIKPAVLDEETLDAYLIEFSVGTQLGVPAANVNVLYLSDLNQNYYGVSVLASGNTYSLQINQSATANINGIASAYPYVNMLSSDNMYHRIYAVNTLGVITLFVEQTTNTTGQFETNQIPFVASDGTQHFVTAQTVLGVTSLVVS